MPTSLEHASSAALTSYQRSGDTVVWQVQERYGLGVLKGLRAMMQREIMLTRRNRCSKLTCELLHSLAPV